MIIIDSKIIPIDEEQIGRIYKIINTVNNKIYIGQTTKTIEERFERHKQLAERHINRYLYDAMNHYGIDNFVVELIEECKKGSLNERERYWISYYKSNNKQYGYNMTDGGGGGNTWKYLSDEERKIASERLTKSNTGKKRSPEVRKRMSEAQRKLGERIKINNELFIKDIKNGYTIDDLVEKYHISRKTIYERCYRIAGKTYAQVRGYSLSGKVPCVLSEETKKG